MRAVKLSVVVAAIAALGWTAATPRVEAAPAVSAAAVYAENCANCHGANGKGVLRGAPDFTSAQWQASRTDAQLKASISNGKGRLMPAWDGKISAGEINALVGHVRGFKK